MTLSIWISIAALLISLSALLLARKKFIADSKLVLARQIADIKDEYGALLRILDEISSQMSEIEKVAKIDLRESKESLEMARSQAQDFYNKLGHKPPVTTDPMTLSTVAIESKHLKESLSKAQSKLLKLTSLVEKKRRPSHRRLKKKG